jgi:hypothetical protein
VPRQQLVEPRVGMIMDACQDVGEPGARIDVVQLGGDDDAVDGGSPFAATVGSAEQPCLSTESNHGVILPISGMRLSSAIGGIRCTGGLCGGTTANIG